MAPGRKRTRKASLDDPVSNQQLASSPPTQKKQKLDDAAKDGQKAPSGSLNIPVDEYCPLNTTHRVHIDDSDRTIFDVLLNQTDSGNNNNKFYRIQLLMPKVASVEDHHTWTRWGRVGERGHSKLLGEGSMSEALAHFQTKFKDKTGHKWDDRLQPAKKGKYTYLERSYEDTSGEDDDGLPGASKRRASKESIENLPSTESKLPGPVQRLMGLIFNQQSFDQTMAAFDYDANKMPLGKLSKRTLKRGYEALKELAAAINDFSSATGSLETLSNGYFSLIPHDFGRRRPPVLGEMSVVQKEIELLESLTEMQLANDIMKSAKMGTAENVNLVDHQYRGLGMVEMTPLDIKSQEFVHLQDYLKNSAGYTHNLEYKVHDIFRIERGGETNRFVKSKYTKIPNSDRRLLWHGSRSTNFGGILSQGLRIAPPEAPVSGYMFGKGVYLADISTKSANYCWANTSGNVGLLLLCEVELGKPPLELTTADYNAEELAQKAKHISTLGIGQTVPAGWKDAACVHPTLQGVSMPDVTTPPKHVDTGSQLLYNEYIIYDVAQIRLRYLLRVEIASGY